MSSQKIYNLPVVSVAWRLALCAILVAVLFFFASQLLRAGLPGLLGIVLRMAGGSLLFVILAVLSLILGLPLYFIFRAMRVTQPWAFAFGAAVVAAVIYAFPDVLPTNGTFSYFGEGHHVVVDGERTAYGWWVFWRGLSTYAALGATAGLMFWGSLRWRPTPSTA